MVDVWIWVDRGAAFVSAMAIAVLWYHIQKCEKRSDKVWRRFDDLAADIKEIVGQVAELKGRIDR